MVNNLCYLVCIQCWETVTRHINYLKLNDIFCWCSIETDTMDYHFNVSTWLEWNFNSHPLTHEKSILTFALQSNECHNSQWLKGEGQFI